MVFKKLNDFKGEEEAWTLVAELIDPLSDIATDEKIGAMLAGKAKMSKKDAAKYIVSNHKEAATRILALLASQDYETFKKEITPALIFMGVVTVLNDTELIDLFLSQGSMTVES